MIEKLIFDDGRKIKFKIKIDEFPFLLKRKLESISKQYHEPLNDLIVTMLDNEVKSVEKLLGEQSV